METVSRSPSSMTKKTLPSVVLIRAQAIDYFSNDCPVFSNAMVSYPIIFPKISGFPDSGADSQKFQSCSQFAFVQITNITCPSIRILWATRSNPSSLQNSGDPV